MRFDWPPATVSYYFAFFSPSSLSLKERWFVR